MSSLSALIFSICATGAAEFNSESEKLVCFDKLVNCSNVVSKEEVYRCAKSLNNKESYEQYINKVRDK